MKRIFKKAGLVSLCCLMGIAFIIMPHTYVTAEEEDEEDIEWFDEEDEIDSLEPENEEDSKKSAQDENQDKKEKTESADSAEDSEEIVTGEEAASSDTDAQAEDTDTDGITEEDSIADLDTVSEDAPADTGADPYEQSLYETYVQYYSKRISAEEWANVVGGKDTYVIREKDTLWDISNVLFGDSSYWPKLWSANPAITNPHLIHPNDSLGFIYGTEGTPPSLSIITGGGLTQTGEGVKTPSVPPVPDFLKNKKIAVPSSGKQVPVMRSFPSSLPPLKLSDKADVSMSDVGIEFKRMNVPTVSFLSHYMSDEPLSGQGVIMGKKEYGKWFHVGQKLILEMRDPVNPGQRLAVIEDRGKLYPDAFGVRGPFGYQMEVQGEVQVIGRVPDSFDLYEAIVTKSLNNVITGSVVLTSDLIQFDYKPTEIAGNAEAQIIGVPTFGTHKKQVAAPYSLIYLNRGSGSGISVGQMYQIKANPSIERQMRYGYDIKLGEVKIVYAEERFATGIITEMSNPVRVGDYIAALSIGLSTQMGYDPLDDVEAVETPTVEETMDDDDLLEEFDSSEEEFSDDDVFEAFE